MTTPTRPSAEPRPWDYATAYVRRADGTAWAGIGYCCDVEHRARYPFGNDRTEKRQRELVLAACSYLHQFRQLVLMPERQRNAVIRDLRAHYEEHPWDQ